jgi:hypothetical protein
MHDENIVGGFMYEKALDGRAGNKFTVLICNIID